jgi:imidazolonepropionase-like amidohydrolase
MIRSILFAALLSVTVNAQAAVIALVNGNVVDIERRAVHANTTVLIDGDRIVRVARSSAVKVPNDAEVIDCTGKWIMPGMVDAHIHLFQSGGLYTRPDVIDLRKIRPYEKERQWVHDQAGDFLARYLAAGITTVIDPGGPMANYAIRDRFNQEEKSPTIYLTGPLVSTYQPPAFAIEDAPMLQTNTAEEAREAVRQQLPRKPDFIKIWYIVRANSPAESTLPVIQAAIEEAHRNGLKVAVHATQLNTAKLALKAGADILVHSIDDAADKEFIALVKDRQVPYIPTLIVHDRYRHALNQEFAPSDHDLALANPVALGSLGDLKHLTAPVTRGGSGLPPPRRYEPAPAVAQNLLQNLKALSAAGALIATGTDAGNIGTPHASSYLDEQIEMQRAGLTNWQILQASTINGARVLGHEKQFGTLAAGKRADILILTANPVADIRNTQAIERVIKRGAVLNTAALIDNSPAALAQRQLNAYNSRNIDAFLEPYSDGVEVYSFAGQLQYSGKENMRTRYAAMFEQTPDLHCELLNRIVVANTVIDHERVTGRPEGVIEAVAIYTTANGKITRVDFAR